ncbi:N-acetylneuraminate lyase-like isoform X2 [Coccinella septempunctata]|uniref:N-acetylneuraminate lyase-like isoform X2 n=1 Tax=Coccinella septempunctata TaxID=41139 RepID=UPI001D08D2F8|nr:N-acetylneuraminate lyase-like isoform X2 [Coccinella septempunctata]
MKLMIICFKRILNLEIIPKYANFLNSLGIDGILVNGTTGEGPSLSKDERKQLATKWKEAVKTTQQHLMVQVGGAPLPDVLELAKHAEEIGVNSILCLPELYFKPTTPAELIDYLKEVGKAAPNTPLLYYHIPSFSCVHINMVDLVNEIKGKVPNFCGLKFTSTQLDEAVLALHANEGKYAVFLGADSVLAGALALGMDSAIGTTFNIFPNLSIDILNAMNQSQTEHAREIQEKLTYTIEVIKKYGSWVATMKHAMNLLTPINVGKARKPLTNLTEGDQKKMADALEFLVSSGVITNYNRKQIKSR